MAHKIIWVLVLFLICHFPVHAQSGMIEGYVMANQEPLPYVHVTLNDDQRITSTDTTGYFRFANLPFEKYNLTISFLGYQKVEKVIILNPDQPIVETNVSLEEQAAIFNKVVVTGTKTFKRQTKSPVIVNVLDEKNLEQVQACNVAEGLKFQPGLRVETDCQTCNYTQLRMNGLGGSYSQILINGRPIFSPLTGLYGLEQIPTNMLERIEVVRGAGSALYGSSAIGGTVNLITKVPEKNEFGLSYTNQQIGGVSDDHIVNGNATIVNEEQNAGIALFATHRSRSAYDHNGDNFSELPEILNNSFGTNLFFLPTADQKLEINLSSIYEYRYGGEMVQKAPHLALQSEERTHRVLMGGVDYQINFNDDNSSCIAYLAGQSNHRDHYTGIFPDEAAAINEHLADPPYGYTENTTFQAGIQLNHRFNSKGSGQHIVTLGSEYLFDDVLDSIGAYNYSIDQQSRNFGVFIQDDWLINDQFTLLAGIRFDRNNLVGGVIVNPRLSLMYTIKDFTQFRFTWGRGFRAPQAFDTDLHIAFAGGGVSRISLDPDLEAERSNSFSASVNYDKATEDFIAGFTLEAFYTILEDAFFLRGIGEDGFGERFVKSNGPDATVQGATLELRANYKQKAQLEGGFTWQSSQYEKPIAYLDELEPIKPFLRTPDHYGFMTFRFFPTNKFEASCSAVFTGTMQIAHLAGAPEQPTDSYVHTNPFTEIDIRLKYVFSLLENGTSLEIFGGIKNLINAYQSDFDTGKNRDSNYVYGPPAPRTFYLGLRFGLRE